MAHDGESNPEGYADLEERQRRAIQRNRITAALEERKAQEAKEQALMEEAQAEYPGHVLLFRVGSRFVTVGTGATLAEQYLGKTSGEFTEATVTGLVEAGLKVAIAERTGQ